ncbi:MAG: ATP-binding protein [Candidatus Eiseniibacteriota bacterium]
MRIGLRWKTLGITLFAPVVLALATFFVVQRNVQEHVDSSSIHETLEHSADMFEVMLAARARSLDDGARVIAQDPRFIALLTLGLEQRDAQFDFTVRGIAHEFNRITRADLYEVFDRRGGLLASVGAAASESGARAALLNQALRGKPAAGVLAQGDAHFQIAVIPVRADRRIVGALLLGNRIGLPLARALQELMRSDVTFLSDGRITSSTLTLDFDRQALRQAVMNLHTETMPDLRSLHALRVPGRAQTYLTLVRRIPNSSPGAIQLYVMQRSYDAETAFMNRMQRDMLVLAMLAAALALLTGLLHSEHLLRPIQGLVRAAQAMREGDYTLPIDARRTDELGYLADRFTEMRGHELTYVSSLEEAARLKSEFISIASHELRTPISVIRGYRDLLAEGTLGELAPQQRQALGAIQDCLEQLVRIAENARQVAEMEGERLSLHLEDFEVDRLIDRALGSALAAATGRDVRVQSRIEPGLPPVRVDAERFVLAITNVLTNGIRFTPDGGWVKVSAYREGRQLAVEVRDSGVGIAPERLGHIFGTGIALREVLNHHSSARLEFRSSGLGLGLAIARGVVEAHGGTISAHSQLGHGASFVIRVPGFVERERLQAA